MKIMEDIAKIVSVFMGLFRIINNMVRKASVKNILVKLESRNDYRQAQAEEMYFTVGKVISPEYDSIYRTFKSRIMNIQTDKFEVKGVFDLNANSFLIFVLCNDRDVAYDGRDNKLAKFVKLFYFRVERIAQQTKVEMCTYTFSDLNEKNLLFDFYLQAEKVLN
jgi:hypothetical protein